MPNVGLRFLGNPAQFVLVAFAVLISIGTALLFLPLAADGPVGLGLEDALFVSTSASTVTGLSTVDAEAFSLFGELVILTLVQVGGFGVMTIGSVMALLVLRHVGLRQRMLAQAEIGAVDLGELRLLLWAIARITLVIEVSLAFVLFVRFWQSGYEDGPGASAYSAVFHSVTAFNNAGLSLYSDGLTRFVGDPFVVLPVTAGFIVGGLGFPVLVEMWRHRPAKMRYPLPTTPSPASRRSSERWSLHARITVGATVALLVIGPAMIWAFEWTNPGTLGPLDFGEKLLAGWFQGVTPRTAGFNTIDIVAMNETSLFATSILMFVGAGPASTSGGIKVTTATVLAAVIWAEVRGERDVTILRRRLPVPMVRAALTIALLSVGLVVGASLMLMASDGLSLNRAVFETASAFGTVGLSAGATASIDTFGHLVLVVIMFCGRVGPVTFATAFALRSSSRLYRHPEERPIIG